MTKKIKTTKTQMDRAKQKKQKLKNKITTLTVRLKKVQNPILKELRNQRTQLTAISHWINTHEVRTSGRKK